MTINRQILLVSRPKGEATLDNFHLAAPNSPNSVTGKCWCATSICHSTPTCVAA